MIFPESSEIQNSLFSSVLTLLELNKFKEAHRISYSLEASIFTEEFEEEYDEKCVKPKDTKKWIYGYNRSKSCMEIIQSKPEGIDFVQKLLPELCVDIFVQLLPETIAKCRLVCKEWRNIIDNTPFLNEARSVFTDLQLTDIKSYQTNRKEQLKDQKDGLPKKYAIHYELPGNKFLDFVKLYDRLETLDLVDVLFNEDILDNLLRKVGPTLRYLRLRGAKLTFGQIAKCAVKHCDLRTLDIGKVNFGEIDFSEEIKIRHLIMTSIRLVKEDQLREKLPKCRKLTHFTLNKCSVDGLSYIDPLRSVPTLQSFSHMGRRNPKELALPSNFFKNGSMETFQALRYLDLRGYDLTTENFCSIFRACPGLWGVNIKGDSVTDGVLNIVKTVCLELRSFDISHCESCTLLGITNFVKARKNTLEHLNIAYTAATLDVNDITDIILQLPYCKVTFC